MVLKVDGIFAKVEMSEHIKFIFFKRTIGTILEGILRFAIICVHMKKSERSTQKLKQSLHVGFLIILMDIVREKKISCVA